MSEDTGVELIEQAEPIENRPLPESRSEIVHFLVDKGYSKNNKSANLLVVTFIIFALILSMVFIYIAWLIDPGDSSALLESAPSAPGDVASPK